MDVERLGELFLINKEQVRCKHSQPVDCGYAGRPTHPSLSPSAKTRRSSSRRTASGKPTGRRSAPCAARSEAPRPPRPAAAAVATIAAAVAPGRRCHSARCGCCRRPPAPARRQPLSSTRQLAGSSGWKQVRRIHPAESTTLLQPPACLGVFARNAPNIAHFTSLHPAARKTHTTRQTRSGWSSG